MLSLGSLPAFAHQYGSQLAAYQSDCYDDLFQTLFGRFLVSANVLSKQAL